MFSNDPEGGLNFNYLKKLLLHAVQRSFTLAPIMPCNCVSIAITFIGNILAIIIITF